MHSKKKELLQNFPALSVESASVQNSVFLSSAQSKLLNQPSVAMQEEYLLNYKHCTF
jgi:hypothetical protein